MVIRAKLVDISWFLPCISSKLNLNLYSYKYDLPTCNDITNDLYLKSDDIATSNEIYVNLRDAETKSCTEILPTKSKYKVLNSIYNSM